MWYENLLEKLKIVSFYTIEDGAQSPSGLLIVVSVIAIIICIALADTAKSDRSFSSSIREYAYNMLMLSAIVNILRCFYPKIAAIGFNITFNVGIWILIVGICFGVLLSDRSILLKMFYITVIATIIVKFFFPIKILRLFEIITVCMMGVNLIYLIIKWKKWKGDLQDNEVKDTGIFRFLGATLDDMKWSMYNCILWAVIFDLVIAATCLGAMYVRFRVL